MNTFLKKNKNKKQQLPSSVRCFESILSLGEYTNHNDIINIENIKL